MGLAVDVACQSGGQVSRVHQLEWETGEGAQGEMDEGDPSQFHPPPPWATRDPTTHAIFVRSRHIHAKKCRHSLEFGGSGKNITGNEVGGGGWFQYWEIPGLGVTPAAQLHVYTGQAYAAASVQQEQQQQQ